ncbi:MAG: hypothetical protein IKX59_02975 [Bacteroidales bacterium]|nr:hypothetical protein [Bacteroidales bacterium]
MKLKKYLSFFIVFLFVLGLVVSCIVLAVRNDMLTAKSNRQLEAINDFFEVRDAIISNRYLLDSIAEQAEENQLFTVTGPTVRREDVNEYGKDIILYYFYRFHKDSTFFVFDFGPFNHDNCGINLMEKFSINNKLAILRERDSLQFVNSIKETYGICNNIADSTCTLFWGYLNSRFSFHEPKEYITILLYKKGMVYRIIKSELKMDELDQEMNNYNEKEVINSTHLFDNWYLFEVKNDSSVPKE